MKSAHALSATIFVLAAGVAHCCYAQTAKINPFIEKSISAPALKNIMDAERVFCYNVETAPENYQGYTIDQMALTGFCGILEKEHADLFRNEFFKTETNISTTTAQCVISPKIMLRFVRGIDATDVLFSNPCPSISVFYGGTFKSFNAAPAVKSIEGVVEVFTGLKTEFVSPALLNQTFPIGVTLNDEQKALVNQQKSAQPIRHWTDQSPKAPVQAPKEEGPKGWNKMKKN